MSIIERWYSMRQLALASDSERCEEKTDRVEGINRTITSFPISAFPTYEQKLEYHNTRKIS